GVIAVTPVPFNVTVCGLLAALSVMVTFAVRAPTANGVNVTLIAQLAFAASVVGLSGHVVVCAKSPAFVPVIPMLAIVSAPGPLFVTVTLCAALVVFTVWLAYVNVPGATVTCDAAVPFSVTICGVPLPLSVILTFAVRAPAASGENVTLTVQDVC